jgi:hypothetical protein
MSQTTSDERLLTKTPEAAFLLVMSKEFGFSPRVSREVLHTAQEMLRGTGASLRPGQIRRIVAKRDAPFGPPLSATDKVEVTLTLDAGVDDLAVKRTQGLEGVRRGRILRLLDEAVEQGGVLTQEDLAQLLGVTRRTIVRDVKVLQQEGHLLHTRGRMKGVGRGQTHKVRIIELWLNRVGYDQIARQVYHSPQAIQRYVSTFLRMVVLQRQGTVVSDIAFLTGTSERLVTDYLALAAVAESVPHRQAKLEEELQRVSSWRKTVPEQKKTESQP